MFNKTEQEIMKNWNGDISKPVVSICSITYNHEKFIAESIDSFLMQETDFPFEIVIGEDCSTDATKKVIEEYIEKYPNLIKLIISYDNVGMNKNFIRTMKSCKGEYIAICEGDDYWTDTKKIQIQKDFLELNNEYAITYTSVEAFNENGIITGYKGGAEKDLEAIELAKISALNTLTVCFRNIVHDFPYEYQCTKFADLFLWSLLGAYGKGKYLSDIKPSKYRITSSGAFSGQTIQHRKEMSMFTNSALYAYYYRIGNKELADFFQERHLRAAISAFGLYAFLKLILKKLYKGNKWKK